MKIQSFLILSLMMLLLSACTTQAQDGIYPAQPMEMELDAGEYFGELNGAFVLLDSGKNVIYRYNPEGCSRGLLPASSFKIANSLIGLETGVILGADHLREWDGTTYPVPSWNQDHTLETAIQNSVVWYYQAVAREIGPEKMSEWVKRINYGNGDIGGGIDQFWLIGALRISADEQIEFLQGFYLEELGFSTRSYQIVKDILVLDSDLPGVLRGKTGSTVMEDGTSIGWFVGYLEVEDGPLFFALNLVGPQPEINGVLAKQLTLNLFSAKPWEE